jgi:hypothetical protein
MTNSIDRDQWLNVTSESPAKILIVTDSYIYSSLNNTTLLSLLLILFLFRAFVVFLHS